MTNLEDLGKRIKDKRIELNMTQEELAKKVGYTSRSSINKIELGLVDLPQSKITMIAQALDVSVAYLMGWNLKIKDRVNKNIGHNIYLQRAKLRLTQQQLADRVGVSEATIAALENGQEAAGEELLYDICDVFGLIPSNILGCDDEPYDENTKYLLSRRNNIGMYPLKKKKLPLLGNVACGEPIFAEESFDAYVSVGADVEADFCLRAKGDSMINARIFDGDVLFVKSQPMVEDGEIAVVLVEDEATVKRVYYDRENSTITLVPENPTYKVMRFMGEQLNQIRILGKVIAGQYDVR